MKEELLRMQEKLRSLASTNAEQAAIVELDQSKVGRLSRMDAMQSQAIAQETEKRREVMLRAIDAALLRIEAGDYGICLECDKPINPQRLAVDPTAEYCIECATKSES